MAKIKFFRTSAPICSIEFTVNPSYGGGDSGEIGYLQPKDRSGGGDWYIGDKGINPDNYRRLSFDDNPVEDWEAFLAFLGKVNGSTYDFYFYDSDERTHTAWIFNSNKIPFQKVRHRHMAFDIELVIEIEEIYRAENQTLRIDAAGDGGEFIWNPLVDLTNYSEASAGVERKKILIHDPTNDKDLEGWLGGAGVGETLGSEIVTGTLTAGVLYKITATQTNHFGTGLVVGSYFTSNGTETCDSNNKVKRVTDPPAAGLRVYTTDMGSTRGWAVKDSGFDYNGTNLTVSIQKYAS